MSAVLVRDGAVFAAHIPDPTAADVRRGCVAVAGGRIVAVGDEATCRAALPGDVEVIDAAGGTVLPGMVDCHGHLLNLGETEVDLDLRATGSFDEAVGIVARAARAAEPGEWLVGRGWDHARWGLTDYPDAAVLSVVAARNPVLLNRFDGHAAIVNDAALAAAGIGVATPDPPDGRIVRRRDGTPTGVLLEGAARPARAAVPPLSVQQRRRMLRLGARRCLSLGVTGVFDAIDEHAWLDDYRALIDDGVPLPRIHGMLSVPGAGAADLFDRYGDLALTLRRLRLILDGGLGARGAWLAEPYGDEPESVGFRMLPDDAVPAAANAVLDKGFSLCVHAIGDRAASALLDWYAAAAGRADHRFMIEHASLLADRDVARIAALGVIASVQPVHAVDDAAWLSSRLGARTARAYRFGDLRRAGAILACGSDFPVASPNPLLGIQAAVTAEPARRLTRAEAVYGYTRWAAYAAFAEAELGSLEPGKRADLVVLDRDLFSVPAEQVGELTVRHTIVGGRVRYREGEFA